MTDTEAGTALTAEERLTHLRNAVYIQQSNANVVLPTEDVKWLLDAARPATDPAGLDEECAECGARCFIKSHQSRPATDPAGLERALADAIRDEWPIQWANDQEGTKRSFDEIARVLLNHPKVAARLSVADGPGPDIEVLVDGDTPVGVAAHSIEGVEALLADGPGPEERPDLEAAARAYIEWRDRRAAQWDAVARHDHEHGMTPCPEWDELTSEPFDIDQRLDDAIRAALSRPLPENREEPSR